MAFGIDYMVITKNEKQARDLAEYIKELCDRDYEPEDEEHAVRGYGITVEPYQDYWVLKSTFNACFPFDVGYWAHKEGKEYLVQNIFFLAEEHNNGDIELYVEGNLYYDDEFTAALGDVVIVGNENEEAMREDTDIPEELHELIVKWFTYNLE